MTEQRCGNCTYFHDDTTTCRRHAPQPLNIVMSDRAVPDTLRRTTAWPRVAADDWCGDWILRSEATKVKGHRS